MANVSQTIRMFGNAALDILSTIGELGGSKEDGLIIEAIDRAWR